jgi:hypothetical protein
MMMSFKEITERVNRDNNLVVTELQMLAEIIAKNNPKYKKYLEAKKCDDEGLGIFKFIEMDYKSFLKEVVFAYKQDFKEDYDNLFKRNCTFIQVFGHFDINSYKIKDNKVIFYSIIDKKQAYMEVEIIDILIDILMLKDRTKVYDAIIRELVTVPIKYK